MGNTTTYQYDPNGNRTGLADANGNSTSYVYDARNLLTSVTDAEGGVVTYAYDAVGNRTSMTDANNHTTSYTYDALNRLLSVSDPLNLVTSYQYDQVSNRTRKTRPDGVMINYSYDALDRLAQITYPGGTITYTYDQVGNRAQMVDPLGTTTYDYDDLDRLVEITSPNGTLGYGYDLNDNRTELTYPDGKVVAYTYDAANRMATVTDWDGRVTSYSYDNASRQTGIHYPNDIQATYTYDNADRLLSIVHEHPTNGVIASFGYTLDAVGNRLSMVDQDGTTTYTYDDLYRLTGVTYPDGEAVTYSYDPMGNRLSMTSSVNGTTTYTYDAGDRLLSFTEPGGITNLSWDANGNMTGKGSAVYTFDPLDQLVQVLDGATTVQFGYDGDGVRLRKTVNGVTTDYLQDTASPLSLVLQESSSAQIFHYIYGYDLVSQIDNFDAKVFYHYDGLGSTRALSNAIGQRTDIYSYDAFGSVRSQNGNTIQTYTFTGEQAEEEINLIYLRARYYDYEIGRFISPDAYPGTIINPRSLNKYVYAQNNPVILVDPSGKVINLGTAAIGAVVGATVNTAWYAVVDVGIKGEDFSYATAIGKAAGGAFTGGTAGLTLGGSIIVGGAMRGAGGYVIENAVENLIKHHGDVSKITDGMSVSGIIGSSVAGGVSSGILKGIGSLPGYLKPTLKAPLNQLSLFDNTYGARIYDVVGYEISRNLIGQGMKELFGALWNEFEKETRFGIVSSVFAPTLPLWKADMGYPPSNPK